ncbi:deaminase [Streptomyces spongiicola]|uniref:Deaminase n=1 Tax=Streptomyces spongiicola TaxID=1690221 RepID=A0ABM6V8T9_9ACTN|nr:RibD family protein [Streptomyces spongiicola]AWK10291.1 deaminase [Streptomyces spongiicola]
MSGLHDDRRADEVAAVDARSAWERLLAVRTPAQAEAAGLHRDGHGRYRWRDGASAEADLLAERYLPLCLAGPRFTFAQLGQSLDGFIATRQGDADYVTGPEDREHLHRLRALSDAVVVGAGTAAADDPRLTVRACPGPDPVRVVLDPHGRVPPGRRLFTDGAAPTLWVVGARQAPEDGTAGAGVDVLALPDSAAFTPRRLVHELARRGLGRVLVEGGGVTVSRFLHERALDRLYVTVAPVLIGDGVPGLAFPGPDAMRDALRPHVRRAFLGEDTLYELDLRAPRSGEPLDGEYGGTGEGGGEGQ